MYKFSGLTPTTLQALSKLISNGDVADEIIGVIRSVISQFSVKNSEGDTIEVAVNVRFVHCFLVIKIAFYFKILTITFFIDSGE